MLFALLGFFDLAQFVRSYHGSSQASWIIALLWICNGIFNLLLLYSGVRLIIHLSEGRIFAARVMMIELTYIGLFLAMSIGPGHLARSISAVIGVGAAGLTFQVLALYPIWSLILLQFSKPS